MSGAELGWLLLSNARLARRPEQKDEAEANAASSPRLAERRQHLQSNCAGGREASRSHARAGFEGVKGTEENEVRAAGDWRSVT